MSDWLSGGDDNQSDGYLGLDDPAMPDTAPAPPTAPQQGGDDGWLTGNAAMPEAGQQAGSAPVADSQGSWLGGDDPFGAAMGDDPYAAQQSTSAATMAPPAPVTYADNAPAPMPSMAQSLSGDLQVTPPRLEHVQPSPRSLGGAKGQLSNLVLDVEVEVEDGHGRASLTVEEFLEMGRGSVVELDTPVDAPILLKVRDKLIARGQLVSINGAYGMRIIEMIGNED
jgi:flagellar motor switch protein FliN/FliY